MEQTTSSRVGCYTFAAEPFHCDFTHQLFMGHLGNHLLNAADKHASQRGFGMDRLLPIHKTWVLSRLTIEMQSMPRENEQFQVETWVESAMRYFTNRNFRIFSGDTIYGYGRSIWAMIDTENRQPQDILAINDGAIQHWLEPTYDCPIAKGSRVKMGDDVQQVGQVTTTYHDIDVNGHVNSIKYIEHVLNLFPLAYYRQHHLRRLEVAYAKESYYGDTLVFYQEKGAEGEYRIKIVSENGSERAEVCRCQLIFEEKR